MPKKVTHEYRQIKERIATNKFVAIRFVIRRYLWISFVAIGVVFVAIRGVPAEAAEMSLVSQFQDIGIGERLKIDVVLNTEDEVINAFEGKLIFPTDLLIVRDIQDSNSIVNFWVEKPSIPQMATNTGTNSNEIIFSGITPGGFNGERGSIFSIVFQANQEGGGMVEIRDAKTLLNDGEGTWTKLSVRNFPFVAIRTSIRGDSWDKALPDTDPPEDFKPETAQDPNIFEGKWFLVFSTQDKGSGIDGYAVHESRRSRHEWQRIENTERIATKMATDEWIEAESPYLLKDQKLRSYIYVKAVDKAGNERVTVVEPRYPLRWYKAWWIWSIIILVIIFSFIVIKRNLWHK